MPTAGPRGGGGTAVAVASHGTGWRAPGGWWAMGLPRPHQHAAGHLSAHAESPQWQSSKESRTFTRCRATQAAARDKPQPWGADGAGWGPRELRPGQRVLKIRRDAIRPPQGASACTSRGGRSGGARPRPHTPPCAASAQPRSLGGGRGRCAPGTLSGKVGREKGLLPTERGPRDTEGSASQAGRGACPWSRGPATEESRRAACPGPGCPASAPILGDGDLPLLQQASVGARRRGRQQRPSGALAGLGRPLPHAPPVQGPQPPRGVGNVTLG